jgi:hypothetical protein
MSQSHSFQFRGAKTPPPRLYLASKRAQKDRTDEGQRSHRQNDVNSQSRRGDHVVTPEVSTSGGVLGERQVNEML